MSKSPKILMGFTGSIACFKGAALLSQLVQQGFEVKTAATPSALKMIGEATLEGLCGNAVFKDAFEPGRMMDHIYLTQWADLALIYPTTANTVNSLAQGIAENTIGNLFLAWDTSKKPWWIAPAMNQAMWRNPITQRSLGTLREVGVRILEPGEGHQACGDVGPGRLMEPTETLTLIQDWRNSR